MKKYLLPLERIFIAPFLLLNLFGRIATSSGDGKESLLPSLAVAALIIYTLC
ncbi:MAG TPA: hypothetical protein VI754_09765 [Bacteriovoracaceae bacterium]|nr:hypothetical protein [Bacteriovoracaceae bacterium]